MAGRKSSLSSESDDLDFLVYRTLGETGDEGERMGPRLHLPDCMLLEDNSPGLRLARAAV